MPRQKPFSKKTATTYALVHRPQDDPLINDSTASSHVFAQISGPSSSSPQPSATTIFSSRKSASKIKHRGDLEDEFGIAFNANEGQAAEQGIYYDDTSYDYMQHMRDLGSGSGGGAGDGAQATWIDAPVRQGERKKKDKKQGLADALRTLDLDDDGFDQEDELKSVSGMSYATTSRSSLAPRRPKYEAQQEIPDAIAGFQPNMDPRLREVLEALDDEAYVEEEDDFFADLAREGGEEIEIEEFEDQLFDGEEDEEGWESDTTEKPNKEYLDAEVPVPVPATATTEQPDVTTSDAAQQTQPPDSSTDGDWLAHFTKSKSSTLAPSTLLRPTAPSISPSLTSTNTARRTKKRKGALTNGSSYSMTSSALARTEALSVLDERFERVANLYLNDDDILEEDEEEDDTLSYMSGMSGLSRASRMTSKTNGTWKSHTSSASRAPQLVQSSTQERQSMQNPAFSSMLDDFLSGVGGHGRGVRMKKGGGSKEENWGKQSGMEQLDEVRRGLGGARVSARWKA